MTRLEEVPVCDLRELAESFDAHRPIRRLYGAILYKQGVSAPTIAAWLDVRPATVYSWFDRLEAAEELERAVRDDRRPGRPPKLRGADRREFFELLAAPPTNAGIDADDWSPQLAKELLSARYEVNYSLRHVRRLLRRAEARSS